MRIESEINLAVEWMDTENFQKMMRGEDYKALLTWETGKGVHVFMNYKWKGGSYFVLRNGMSEEVAKLHWQGASFYDGDGVPELSQKKIKVSHEEVVTNGMKVKISKLNSDEGFQFHNRGDLGKFSEIKKCVNEPQVKEIMEPGKFSIILHSPKNQSLEDIQFQRIKTQIVDTSMQYILLDKENLLKFLKREPYKPLFEWDSIEGMTHLFLGRFQEDSFYIVAVNKHSRVPVRLNVNRSYVIV